MDLGGMTSSMGRAGKFFLMEPNLKESIIKVREMDRVGISGLMEANTSVIGLMELSMVTGEPIGRMVENTMETG